MLRRVLLPTLAAAVLFAAGCGAKFNEVKGTVTLDGQPVDGATVTFFSDDGKNAFSGQTDASGNYTLASGSKPGALAGTYKVTVIWVKRAEGDMTTGGKDYMNHMKNASKDTAKPVKAGPAPLVEGKSAAPKTQTDLPVIYAVATTTPLTATVPTSGPVNLELKTQAAAPPKK